MGLNPGYSHSAVAPDGVVMHHFVGKSSLSMEECRTGGFCAADFERRQYAEPLVYNYDPSADRYDRRTTSVSASSRR